MLPEERYKLVRVLGQGGMGTVYEAEDRRLPGKRWAVKEIRAEELGKDGLAKEAATLIQLSHPNLPHIVDYFVSQDGSCGYVVMEQIDGVTLEQHFAGKKGKLTPQEVVHIATQLCDVLAYLHECFPDPIIHRDLKPANVLVDEHERIVLIDFGTARRYQPKADKDTVQIGTLGFAAPEQLAGGHIDPRTDLYALGAIMFYLLSGGQFPMMAAGAIEEELQGVPAPLIAVIDRLLRTDREERYAAAKAVKDALHQAMREWERDKGVDGRWMRLTYGRKRLLVLLSLYPGAGSTMIGLTISGLLRKYRIAHTYMEHPAAESVLAQWLGPKANGDALTSWLLNEYKEQDWCRDAAAQLKLLFSQETPVLIVDASHVWDDNTVHELLEMADEILITAGPRQLIYGLDATMQRMAMMSAWAEEGRRLSLMWNGAPKGIKPPEQLREIPYTHVVTLPHDERIVRGEWLFNPEWMIRGESDRAWYGALERWLMNKTEEWKLSTTRRKRSFLFGGKKQKKG